MSAYRSDSMIADDVAQSLSEVVCGQRILASVHAGRVTLRGVVAEPALRRLIKDRVGEIDGITAITDLITVDPDALNAVRVLPCNGSVVSLDQARSDRTRN